MAERIETQRTIPAPAPDIFGLLCDPQGHVAIDSTGMLQDADGDPVGAVGDSFVVHMDREALNDYPQLGKYDVTVEIKEFEPDRLISWTVLGQLRPQIGHIYWLPARAGRGRRGHRGHLVLRLVDDRPEVAGRRDFPGVVRGRTTRDAGHSGPHRPPGISTGLADRSGSAVRDQRRYFKNR
jgi:hypothetical protein